MTQDEYIEQRLDDQIDWYDGKSGSAQRAFKQLRRIEIMCAALIPLLAGFTAVHRSIPLALGVLGAVVVVVASFQSLSQHHENWMEYRTTSESLKHEKYLFLTQCEPYARKDAFSLLVKQVEALISKENSAWSQHIRAGVEASAPTEGAC